MPEPSTPTEPAVSSGDTDFDAAVQQVQEAQEPVAEAVVDPIAEESSTPEVVAAPEPEDFSFATLENGERELKMVGGQVFRGKDDAELLEKLAKAQVSATNHIKELKTPRQEQQQAVHQVQDGTSYDQLDPATRALVDMIAPAFRAKDGRDLVDSYQKMQTNQTGFQEVVQNSQLQQTAADFVRTAGDFAPTPRNSELIENTLARYGLEPTVDNLLFAHSALKSQGLYEVPAAPRERDANGQFQPRMPTPPTSASPASGTKPQTTEADLWAMTPAQLAELIEANAA